MIIVRTPVRIPIGGGGTDLPSYYSLYGGEWTSAAINKYVYVTVKRRFEPNYRISYSKTEQVDKPDYIQHPIVREAIKLLKIPSGVEIVTMADVPANTGLGSSGSFAVSLLTGLHAYLREELNTGMPTKKEIAEQACHIAMNLLKEPSGKQDEYIAAHGGLSTFVAEQDGTVTVESLCPQKISVEALRALEKNLMMFYTGVRRKSSDALSIQAKATQSGEKEMIENLHRVKALGREIKETLVAGDFHHFGELLDQHWQEKIKRMGASNSQINSWYEIAKQSGAIGGKLMGAGGGGFFLFYCEDKKDQLRNAMADLGILEHAFSFDLSGTKIMTGF